MGRWRQVPFDLGLALVLLALCLSYALTFSHMLHLSLVEQVFNRPDLAPPRYIGHTHHHSPVEWALIIGPAIVGWGGAAFSAAHLARCLGRRSG